MKTMTTLVMLPINHDAGKRLNWDDVIEYAMRCKAKNEPMQIRRRKKSRKVRAQNRELARLIASQKADEHDRRLRFENAVSN